MCDFYLLYVLVAVAVSLFFLLSSGAGMASYRYVKVLGRVLLLL